MNVIVNIMLPRIVYDGMSVHNNVVKQLMEVH